MTTLVIGIGNADRGDDALGLVVARRLRARGLDGVVVLEHDGEATDLIERLRGADAAILVDAALSGGEPGRVHRFDVAARILPAGLFACSTHGFGPAEGIELARVLGQLPRRCVVYAVEGRAYDLGGPLSPRVSAAVPEVERRVLRELEALARAEPGNWGMHEASLVADLKGGEAAPA